MEAVQFLQKELLPGQFKNIFENNFDDVGFMKLTTNPWVYRSEQQLLILNPTNGCPSQYISLKRSSTNWENFLLVQSNPFFNTIKQEFPNNNSVKNALQTLPGNWTVSADGTIPTEQFNREIEGMVLKMGKSSDTDDLTYREIKKKFKTSYWNDILRDITTFCHLNGLFFQNNSVDLLVEYRTNNPIEWFVGVDFPLRVLSDPFDDDEDRKTTFLQLLEKQKRGVQLLRNNTLFIEAEQDRLATSRPTFNRAFRFGDEEIQWFHLKKDQDITSPCLIVVSKTTHGKTNTRIYVGKNSDVREKKGEEVIGLPSVRVVDLEMETIEFQKRFDRITKRTLSIFTSGGKMGKYLFAANIGKNRTIQGLTTYNPPRLTTIDPLGSFRKDMPPITWLKPKSFTQQYASGINPVLREFTPTSPNQLFVLDGIRFVSLNDVPFPKNNIQLFLNIPFKVFFQLFEGQILWDSGSKILPLKNADELSVAKQPLDSLLVSGFVSGTRRQEVEFEGLEGLKMVKEKNVRDDNGNQFKEAFVLRDDKKRLAYTLTNLPDYGTLSREIIHSESSWNSLIQNTGFISVNKDKGVVFDHSVYPMVELFLTKCEVKGCLISAYNRDRPLSSIALFKKGTTHLWAVRGSQREFIKRTNKREFPITLSRIVLELFGMRFVVKDGGKVFAASFYKGLDNDWTDDERGGLQPQIEDIRASQPVRTDADAHTYNAYTYDFKRVEVNCVGSLENQNDQEQNDVRETEPRKLPSFVRRELGLSDTGGRSSYVPDKQCWYCGLLPVRRLRAKNMLEKLSIDIH